MKFKLQINALVVGVLLIAWIVPARSQVVKLPWKSLGPTGGGVNCLLQSGGSFYAGGYGTIFRSIDKGNTWSSISDSLPQATDINEIIEMDGILYAGTKNGVFLLPANGKYWESINTNWPSNTSSSNSIGPDVNRIAFVNGTLYAGTKDKGLFQYVKNPAQWKEVIDFPTKTTIKDIIGDSEVLLVATDGGTFRLKSGSWNKIDRLPVLVNCFEKKDDLTQVYAGTTDGIYFSSDKGLTWTFIPNNIPGIDKNITSLKITNNTWLAGTHTGLIYRSNNNGVQWSSISGGLTIAGAIRNILYLQDRTSDYLLSTNNIGVYRTDLNSTAWQPSNTGLVNTKINVVVDLDGILYAGLNGKAVVSWDDGNSWKEMSEGFASHTWVNDFIKFNNKIYCATSTGVYYLKASGAAWEVFNAGLPNLPEYREAEGLIAIGPHLFVKTTKGVYRSSNGGNWVFKNQGLPNEFGIIERFTALGTTLCIFSNTGRKGFYHSTDLGDNWVKYEVEAEYITGLTAYDNKLLAAILGMKNVGGGVFESLDKGKTWKRISAVSQYNIVSNDISGEKGSLFSASTVFYKGDTKRPYEEVNFSKDGGNTWTKIGSDKLPGNIQVENLFATQKHLYIASSAHGIWTLPISELYPPIVITKDFINKTATSVTLTGTGSAERFESDFSFEYSEDPALKSGVTTVPLPATPKLGATIPLSAELKSLKASTIYYYRVVGINSGKVRSEGEIKAFETEALTTILTQKVPKDSWVEAASVGGVVNSPSVAVILNNKYHKQTKVNLRTRGLRRSSFDEPIPLTSTGSEFQAMLPADKFDELGLEYYFEVIPPEGFGKRDTTQAITLAIRYPAGKQIDGLSFKNKQYQLLSFPLELDDPTVGKVFGDELPLVKEPLQKDKWRLVIYEGKKSIKDLQTNDRLTPGVGYFLATTEAIILPINTGSGKTVAHHPDFKRNYFEITLKENDWTLIGNPYLWEVKWDDILRANGNPNWKLVTFAGGNLDYKATSIPPFSGGYVKHTAGAPLTLKIPTGSKGERRSAELKSEETMPLLVDFTINNGTNRTHLSGIGLHPSAKAGLDPYDLEMPPILGGFPCLRFASTDQTGQSLTRSILSPMEAGQVWEFSMSEGEASQVVNLSWETLKNEEGKQLWLHDLSSENKVDMISNPSYSFQGKGRFRVYYGTENYITEHLYPEKNLLQAYPNPFAQKTTLRFTLPHSNADYQVRMNLYDLQGRKLGTVVEGAYSNGFHQVEIPLGELPAGAYTVEATFDGERLHTVQRLKLIRQ